jgi:hypothetical protein
MNIEKDLLVRTKVLLECLNTEPLQDQTDIILNEINELISQPEHTEQEPVTDKPTETAMAVMPNGVCVSNVYDAYEEGRKSVMSEQEPITQREAYLRGYAAARKDYKQKVINAFGVDDEH